MSRCARRVVVGQIALRRLTFRKAPSLPELHKLLQNTLNGTDRPWEDDAG